MKKAADIFAASECILKHIKEQPMRIPCTLSALSLLIFTCPQSANAQEETRLQNNGSYTSRLQRKGPDEIFREEVGWRGNMGGVDADIGAGFSFGPSSEVGSGAAISHARFSTNLSIGSHSIRPAVRLDALIPLTGEFETRTRFSLQDIWSMPLPAALVQTVSFSHSSLRDVPDALAYDLQLGWKVGDGIELALPHLSFSEDMAAHGDSQVRVEGRLSVHF